MRVRTLTPRPLSQRERGAVCSGLPIGCVLAREGLEKEEARDRGGHGLLLWPDAPAAYSPRRRAGRSLLLLVVVARLLQHPAEVTVLALRGLQIEDQVLDAQAQVVQAFLQAADRLLDLLVLLAGLIGQFRELLSL